MTHLSEDDLVDLALGAPVDAVAEAHLSQCAECRSARAELLRAVAGVRGSATVTLETPPPGVWAAIERELDDDRTATALPRPVLPAAAAPSQPGDHAGPAHVVPLAGHDRRTTDRRAPHRRTTDERATAARAPWRTRGLVAAACLIGVAVGSAATVALTSRAPAATTIAAADLTALDGPRRLGRADVIATADHVDLRLQIEPVDPGTGFLEVWLINKDLKRMVSVGVMPAGSTQADLTVTRRLLDEGYTVVDISREAFDDKPQHSGDSVARGALPL